MTKENLRFVPSEFQSFSLHINDPVLGGKSVRKKRILPKLKEIFGSIQKKNTLTKIIETSQQDKAKFERIEFIKRFKDVITKKAQVDR